MRISLLAALLSTALFPLTANAQDHGQRGHHDRGSHVARSNRPDRPARAERAVRPAITARAPRVDPVARNDNRARAIRRVDPNAFGADRTLPRATAAQRNDDQRRWRDRNRDRDARQERNAREDRRDRREDRAERRRDRNDRAERRWDRSMADWRDHYRGDYRVEDRQRWSRRHSGNSDNRWGRSERWDNGDRWDRGRWDRNDRFDHRWRDDHRYNWRDYRVRNRTVFHLPRYYAPYGWDYGYRRFSVGFRLDSLLFGSSYWITDPYYYRLPPAYGPYRWVRYYDDALLVDISTGEVVDVVYGIFW